jgi:hypothetical protein
MQAPASKRSFAPKQSTGSPIASKQHVFKRVPNFKQPVSKQPIVSGLPVTVVTDLPVTQQSIAPGLPDSPQLIASGLPVTQQSIASGLPEEINDFLIAWGLANSPTNSPTKPQVVTSDFGKPQVVTSDLPKLDVVSSLNTLISALPQAQTKGLYDDEIAFQFDKEMAAIFTEIWFGNDKARKKELQQHFQKSYPNYDYNATVRKGYSKMVFLKPYKPHKEVVNKTPIATVIGFFPEDALPRDGSVFRVTLTVFDMKKFKDVWYNKDKTIKYVLIKHIQDTYPGYRCTLDEKNQLDVIFTPYGMQQEVVVDDETISEVCQFFTEESKIDDGAGFLVFLDDQDIRKFKAVWFNKQAKPKLIAFFKTYANSLFATLKEGHPNVVFFEPFALHLQDTGVTSNASNDEVIGLFPGNARSDGPFSVTLGINEMKKFKNIWFNPDKTGKNQLITHFKDVYPGYTCMVKKEHPQDVFFELYTNKYKKV